METPHDDSDTQLTVRVGTREIYDAVTLLRGDLVRLIDSVTGIGDTLKDHEQRIRSTEKTLARLKYGWPVTMVLGLAGTIATALLK